MRFLLTIVVVFLIGIPVARAVTPEPGIWLINEESTGRPGRGFQIDFQGSTIVITYYGYRMNGTSTYYLGAGQLKGDLFEADLLDYAGGSYLGGPKQDASLVGAIGKVSVKFSSNTAGTISLPGESAKAISRGAFFDSTQRFNRMFEGIAFNVVPFPIKDSATKFQFDLKPGVFSLTRASFFGGTCKFGGTYSLTGAGIASSGTYQCSDFTSGTYEAVDLKVDENGLYTGVFFTTANGSGTKNKETHAGM